MLVSNLISVELFHPTEMKVRWPKVPKNNIWVYRNVLKRLQKGGLGVWHIIQRNVFNNLFWIDFSLNSHELKQSIHYIFHLCVSKSTPSLLFHYWPPSGAFSDMSRILYAAFLPTILIWSIRRPITWPWQQKFCLKNKDGLKDYEYASCNNFSPLAQSNITFTKKRKSLCFSTILSQSGLVHIQPSEGAQVYKWLVWGVLVCSDLVCSDLGTWWFNQSLGATFPIQLAWPTPTHSWRFLLTHTLKWVLWHRFAGYPLLRPWFACL